SGAPHTKAPPRAPPPTTPSSRGRTTAAAAPARRQGEAGPAAPPRRYRGRAHPRNSAGTKNSSHAFATISAGRSCSLVASRGPGGILKHDAIAVGILERASHPVPVRVEGGDGAVAGAYHSVDPPLPRTPVGQVE